ncbi:MAG: Ig-like domain-containing protein [Deltaproteobacteria bacterium]|nr:Ig-like domain-containing protein [Deltaproteobacteria bacterium]
MRRSELQVVVLLLGVLTAACGKDEPGAAALPDVVTLQPKDGATDVSVGERVRAVIARDNGAACRFDMATTTLTVTRDGVEVAGARVHFVDGLRIDFTPDGLFDYSATYVAEVKTPCAQTARATFTTRAVPAGGVTIAEGDVFRINNIAVSEPQAIAPLLADFLTDGNLVLKVMAVGSDSVRLLGAEGKVVSDPMVPDPALRVVAENAFLFPMIGTFKWPYFQNVGSLSIPVNENAGVKVYLTLNHFEVSGMFTGTSPYAEIVAGVIRATSPCDEVCAVADTDLQLVCSNRSLMCDGEGNLNVVGSFEAAANDLRLWQTIEVTPAPGSTVATSTTLSLTPSRAVNPTKAGAVMFELYGPGHAAVPLAETVLTPDGFLATVKPQAALAPNTTYTALAVALDVVEWQFSTTP